MSVEGSTLIVRVDAFKFWFEEPLGNPFDLSRYFGEKQQALRHLLSCKYVGPAPVLLFLGLCILPATDDLLSSLCASIAKKHTTYARGLKFVG